VTLAMKRITALGFVAASLFAGPLGAQLSSASAGAQVSWESYTFDDPSAVGLRAITLLAVPVVVQPIATRALRLIVSAAYAEGTVERVDGSKATISGPTDTEVRVFLSPQQALTLSAALLVPSGKARQTTEEAEVSGILAAELLPFRVSNWGMGGGADASVSLAVPAGALALGLRAGYQVSREFEPLDGQPFVYRPGNQLYGRVAADLNVGRAGKLSAHVTVQQFRADELDGQNLYQSGDRLQAMASYAFAAGSRSSAVVYAGALHRAQPTLTTAAGTAPTRDLWLAGGGMRLGTPAGVLTPGVDLRVFRRDDGLGQGFAAGFGSALELRFGDGTVAIPSARYRIGRIVASEGVETNFTGVDLSVTLRSVAR
jgi:hypothetical protein